MWEPQLCADTTSDLTVPLDQHEPGLGTNESQVLGVRTTPPDPPGKSQCDGARWFI